MYNVFEDLPVTPYGIVSVDPEIAVVLGLAGFVPVGNVAGFGNIAYRELPGNIKDYQVFDDDGQEIYFLSMDTSEVSGSIDYFADFVTIHNDRVIIVDIQNGIEIMPLVKLDADFGSVLAFSYRDQVYGLDSDDDGLRLHNLTDEAFQIMRFGYDMINAGSTLAGGCLLAGSIKCLLPDNRQLSKAKMLGLKVNHVSFGFSIPQIDTVQLYSIDYSSNSFLLDRKEHNLEYKIYSRFAEDSQICEYIGYLEYID